MKLIVGLGNPGNEYNFTRHNFGFLLLDFYAKTQGLTWQKPKFNALWCKSGDQIFIKPQDFYNNSGQAVQAFAHFYKISPDQVFVICDDIDLPFGKTRFRQNGSSGGNNGLKSIITHLGTENFPRLRLGTANPLLHDTLSSTDFVLGHFSAAEKTALPEILREGTCKLQDFLTQ